MHRGPRRLVAALAVAAGVLLAGCGGDGGDGGGGGGGGAAEGEPLSAVFAAAADKTSQAGTSRFALTSTTTGGGQTVEVSGEGAFDYSAGRGTMTLNLPGLGQTTTIIDGSIVYQQLPQAQAAQLGGSWMRIDTQAVTGADQSALSGNNDPSAALEWLKGASDDITEVGQEDVRGESTTHYRVVLDLQKAAEASGQDAAATEQVLQSVASPTFPADVWIDGEGRLRKISYDLDLSVGEQTGTSSTSMELWDFGTEVAVQPPPEGEIVDYSELGQAVQDQAAQLEEEAARLQEELESAAGTGG